MENTVAKTIATQIGNRAFFMLGARDLVAVEQGLQFAIRGTKVANKVRVVLAGDDTYTVEFWKCRGLNQKLVSSREGVYVDRLHATIEAQTGLRTSL